MKRSRESNREASPEQLLAVGFAHHARAWAARAGASADSVAAVGEAARALSLAVDGGHVCIELDALARSGDGDPGPGPDTDGSMGAGTGAGPAAGTGAATPRDARAWRVLLLASGVVGRPEAPGAMPMILDAGDRLYLHRHFDYERRLATRLVQARGAGVDPAPTAPALHARLVELFPRDGGMTSADADWQQLAAALALRGRLTIVSGGPGTGKTTTVVNLLACLLELDPHCRVALAAPTGKAAARMTDAIRQRAGHLPVAIRERLPTESSTVHRLLGVKSSGAGFVHDAGNPLAIDALVVDEASMLDLALATQLLEAVPPAARIILLGDKDQLAAVESGAVFADLSADPTLSDACVADLARMTGTPAFAIRTPPPQTASALHDAAVWLTRTYRFASDSGIARLARLVNAGDAGGALDWLGEADPARATGVTWLPDIDAMEGARSGMSTLAREALPAMDEGYASFVETVAAGPGRHAAVTEAFGRFRVLCAVRDGSRGVVALNTELTRRFRAALGLPGLDDGPGGSPWFTGRPVIVLNNDYVLRLFNGDIGIALPDATGELLVHFPDANAADGFRAIAPVRMPRHETAFAMTVHKSQGSEFDGVLVVLPERRSRVLTRELLYTGITRARSRVALVAGAGVLEATIRTATRRHSGLLARLAESAPPPGGD